MDVCSLLREVEQLHTEVSAMKHALQLQAETGEGLRTLTVDVSRQVTVLEKYSDHGCTEHLAPVRSLDAANASAARTIHCGCCWIGGGERCAKR